jgi:hypothetical protein
VVFPEVAEKGQQIKARFPELSIRELQLNISYLRLPQAEYGIFEIVFICLPGAERVCDTSRTDARRNQNLCDDSAMTLENGGMLPAF